MEDNILNKLKTQKSKVEFILLSYPETRSSDSDLIYRYVEYFHTPKDNNFYEIKMSFLRDLLREAPPMDSFKRLRADFNKEGKYLGTPEVQEERKKRGNKFRKIFKEGLF